MRLQRRRSALQRAQSWCCLGPKLLESRPRNKHGSKREFGLIEESRSATCRSCGYLSCTQLCLRDGRQGIPGFAAPEKKEIQSGKLSLGTSEAEAAALPAVGPAQRIWSAHVSTLHPCQESNDALAGVATAPSGCLVETPRSGEDMSTPGT